MSAIEQAKKNIARAEELAQAVKDGKKVQLSVCQYWPVTTNKSADEFFASLGKGAEYRIIEPKRRRPWTREEAERHVGWVLVSPDGKRSVIGFTHGNSIHWPHNPNPHFSDLVNGWRVHLPGQPDDLKPCSVEE